MTEEKARMSVGKKIMIVLIIAFALLAAGAYGLGVWYFRDHFLPGTIINGFHCSFMTVEESEALLNKKVGAYVLAVETMNNGQESISAGQVDLVYVPDGSVQKFMESQDSLKWFLSVGQESIYETKTAVVFDQDKMHEAVKGLRCMQSENITQPVDAGLVDDGEKFVISPEVEGNAPDEEKLFALIKEAMTTGKTAVNLEAEGIYKKPSVYRDDEQLIENCERVNTFMDVIITYDFADRTETVDRNLIKNWLTRNENGDYTLDENLIAAYVDELGYKYDTFGSTRQFRTYDGRQITVSGGDYGWVIDQRAEVPALKEAILSGVTQVREPIYTYKGWSRATNDIGYTYIEVDITNQRMVFYKDGYPIVDTPVVTGIPGNTDTATPTGCFAIDAMQSPAVLTGDGYQANVSYWMPFWGNVGIHDATWRSEFGGTIYFSNGSHGCVNAPYDKVQQIYNNIDIGAPVIVYQ